MYHIQDACLTELIIKKSRFLTYLYPCKDEESAKEYIRQLRKQHPNANHHCYAFIIGDQNELQRSNDDGEPQGSAGVPMLEVLRQRQMQDILAVTVRYFGGIKLGAGGLIRAYGGSVSQALDQAIITKKQMMQKCQLDFSYDLIGKLDHFFRSEHITVLTKEYHELVSYTFLCEQIPYAPIAELCQGAYTPIHLAQVSVDVPLTPQEHS